MVQKLKLIISEKGNDIETVLEETVSDPSLLYKTLEEFKIKVNAALTKLIQESGDIDQGADDSKSENDDEEEEEEEEEDEVLLNHKRKKKKM